MKTIEEELINALYKAEAITEDAKACLSKVRGDSQLLFKTTYMWWRIWKSFSDTMLGVITYIPMEKSPWTSCRVQIIVKLIANKWAWGRCLWKRVVVPSGMRPSSWARRYPRQPRERQPPPGTVTEKLSGDTYQPVNLPWPAKREGRGKQPHKYTNTSSNSVGCLHIIRHLQGAKSFWYTDQFDCF